MSFSMFSKALKSKSLSLPKSLSLSSSLKSVPKSFATSQSRSFSSSTEPVKVAITGAAGQIGYSLAFRVASGQLLGPNQPVILQLIELPMEKAMNALRGVSMELDDCAFPLLKGIVQTSDPDRGFEDADYALLVGSKPRGPGQERADLMKDNGAIFAPTGKSLNHFAKPSVKVCVVGNPANTNCLIASTHAPNIPAQNFSAMTRLDHNRAVAQLAQKAGVHLTEIQKLCIWGNHSSTQYPDISHTTISGQPAKSVVDDEKWYRESFIPDVQQRGAAIIKARGASSAASAANGCLDHVYDWVNGTSDWVSMAVPSDGSYDVPEGVFFSYPVTCKKGNYEIVQGLKIDEFSGEMIEATKKELFEERDMVAHLL